MQKTGERTSRVKTQLMRLPINTATHLSLSIKAHRPHLRDALVHVLVPKCRSAQSSLGLRSCPSLDSPRNSLAYVMLRVWHHSSPLTCRPFAGHPSPKHLKERHCCSGFLGPGSVFIQRFSTPPSKRPCTNDVPFCRYFMASPTCATARVGATHGSCVALRSPSASSMAAMSL
jgi:hypothetical protein